uniref:Uncharacterized protein n=1 Tax=Arundo donax TaxID=35708 RepID=A0A0A9GHK9_ARUDO
MHSISSALLPTSLGEFPHIKQPERAAITAQDTPPIHLAVIGTQHGVVHVRLLGVSVEHVVDEARQAKPEHVRWRHGERRAEQAGGGGDGRQRVAVARGVRDVEHVP